MEKNATTKLYILGEDAKFLESAMQRAGVSSLESLADALGYSVRTLRGIKYGEVKLSRFMREAIEKLVEVKSPRAPILYDGTQEVGVVKEEAKENGRLEIPSDVLADLMRLAARYSIKPDDALRLVFDAFFNRLKP